MMEIYKKTIWNNKKKCFPKCHGKTIRYYKKHVIFNTELCSDDRRGYKMWLMKTSDLCKVKRRL